MQYAQFVKKHNLSDILSADNNEEGDMVNDNNTMDSQSDNNNDEQHDIDEQSANDTTCAVREPNITEEDKEEGVGPETPPAEPISVEVIIAIDEKGIIILHSLTPISTLMHSQAAPQWD